MTNFTHDDLKALDDAIKQGVKTVEYSDRRVEYRTLNEMIRLRNLMKNEVEPENRGPQRVYASHTKGLYNR